MCLRESQKFAGGAGEFKKGPISSAEQNDLIGTRLWER